MPKATVIVGDLEFTIENCSWSVNYGEPAPADYSGGARPIGGPNETSIFLQGRLIAITSRGVDALALGPPRKRRPKSKRKKVVR